eukprot:CAMPEP_0117665410 /NCGR_PEP_ID=MMETSP0804-20121206/9793_1 /TAXON_ID=1074897 /ORGANISM="Tetraselmis astigmatica, Strain CCMP880" /LENGTH=484 /DNA_ID=CAMNT_0005472817 /DNA_START=480 /DNA_END=1931 /DNA_ORIENTATION=+
MYLLANRQQVVDADKQAQLKSFLSIAGDVDTFETYKDRHDWESLNGLQKRWLKVSFGCQLISQSPPFNNFITAVIVLASALVGIQTYEAMEYIPGRETNTPISKVWNLMDEVVLYIFLAEVLVKIMAEGLRPWRYFGQHNAQASGEDSQSSKSSEDHMGELWKTTTSVMTNKSACTTGNGDLMMANDGGDKEDEMKKGGCWHQFSLSDLRLDFWNIFDFLVVLVCFLPLGAEMIAVIRLFRLLRVLKLVKALPELQVLVVGLLGSLTSIFYVGLLLVLVFYFYAVLCVTMLRGNDPVHWPSLQVAFMTLFRMTTLDDWIDITYTAMLGCKTYGYGFREDWCTNGGSHAMGWIIVPVFVSFVIVATFVVLNLFIGVINENMGLAKEQLMEMKKEEAAKKMAGETGAEMKELRLLDKRMVRLTKRTTRLHQSMSTVQYDTRTLVEKLMKKSQEYQVDKCAVTPKLNAVQRGMSRMHVSHEDHSKPW